MVKSKVIFEDEEQVEIKYPCFELKDIVEYYFEIYTPNNSITPFSLVALPNANILVSIYISDSSQTFKVHREHGIIDTSGDKISGSLTEAITVIHAPGTHEFSINSSREFCTPVCLKIFQLWWIIICLCKSI